MGRAIVAAVGRSRAPGSLARLAGGDRAAIVAAVGPKLRDVDMIDRDDRRALDPHEQARIEPSLEIAHRLAGDGAPLARTAHRIVIVVPSSGSKLAP